MAAHLLDALLLGLAVPLVAAALYLLLLTFCSSVAGAPPPSSRRLRFDVIVPAHNEAAVLERCLASLRRMDWPADRWRLLVVADNCTDDTAQRARSAGAEVLERDDRGRRGKGHALRHAFDHSQAARSSDAVVVVDADTEVASNLLEAFAARIEGGAGVVQAHYGVLNPGDSWRTGLMAIAHGAAHGVRSRARERLGLSCGLRGNGWCLTHATLAAVPYQAYSKTEDLEYGIALGLSGHRIHYAGEAWADAVMESAAAVAGGQRQRWEGGRLALLRSQSLPLLAAALRRPSRVCLDLALDLLVLPLSYLCMGLLLLIAGAALKSWLLMVPSAWWLPTAVAGLGLVLYVLRGWQLSGRGIAGLRDLLHAPWFVVWKLGLLLRRSASGWLPTRRQTR
jgi:cellulose synthase/poly-beta-1,6-N-acetylglucosamine synthase-like glycosyltransferase